MIFNSFIILNWSFNFIMKSILQNIIKIIKFIVFYPHFFLINFVLYKEN